MKIIPTILTSDERGLEKRFRQAASFTGAVHLDFMDGEFVPSRSISAEAVARLKPPLIFEAHLMVRKPTAYLAPLKEADARTIIFHVECDEPAEKVVEEIKKLGMEPGIAVKPDTPLADVLVLAGLVERFHFLTVHPGFNAQPFVPAGLNKAYHFKQQFRSKQVSVDGAVKLNNFGTFKDAGIDIACIGSGIWSTWNPGRTYRKFLKLAKEF